MTFFNIHGISILKNSTSIIFLFNDNESLNFVIQFINIERIIVFYFYLQFIIKNLVNDMILKHKKNNFIAESLHKIKFFIA